VKKTGQIFKELSALHQKGADPAGAEGQELAKRWWDMVTEFTGGDPELLKALISAGMDIEAWPEETKPFREAVGQFLGAALSTYLRERNIELPGLEEIKHE
jgi:hypothetical protein